MLIPVPATADFAAGIEAFRRGDFAEARIQFAPLAYEGVPAAQANFGLMYYKGYGVILDHREAFYWFQLAATQGQPFAQFNLGSMYLNGEAAPRDVIVGYMWLVLARDGGHEASVQTLATLEGTMSQEQITIGRGLAALWKQKISLSASSEQP